MKLGKNLFFSTFIAIIILIVIEISLQITSLISPRINILLSRQIVTKRSIKDKALGLRPNPLYFEHDRKGFRNKSVPNKVNIVAMGDSQTYGGSVSRNQAWPQQLEKLSKIKTYNMAFDGYGPAHNLLLLEEAIDLKPELIINAFYAGNDLYDSYSLIYNRKQLLKLKSPDQKVINAILELENIEPLDEKIFRLLKMSIIIGEKDRPLTYGVFKEFLAEHSKLYGLLRILKLSIIINLNNKDKNNSWKSIKQHTIKHKGFCQIFDNGDLRMIFTPDYRMCAVNLDDPRIAEGLRISLETIRLMNERAKKREIGFIVLFLPTKEMVYRDIVYEESADIPKAYKTLIENEELFWQKTKVFLRNQRIYFIDALPALRAGIKNGNQPYKVSPDGHLNSIGQRAVAELIYSEIKNRSF